MMLLVLIAYLNILGHRPYPSMNHTQINAGHFCRPGYSLREVDHDFYCFDQSVIIPKQSTYTVVPKTDGLSTQTRAAFVRVQGVTGTVFSETGQSPGIVVSFVASATNPGMVDKTLSAFNLKLTSENITNIERDWEQLSSSHPPLLYQSVLQTDTVSIISMRRDQKPTDIAASLFLSILSLSGVEKASSSPIETR